MGQGIQSTRTELAEVVCNLLNLPFGARIPFYGKGKTVEVTNNRFTGVFGET